MGDSDIQPLTKSKEITFHATFSARSQRPRFLLVEQNQAHKRFSVQLPLCTSDSMKTLHINRPIQIATQRTTAKALVEICNRGSINEARGWGFSLYCFFVIQGSFQANVCRTWLELAWRDERYELLISLSGQLSFEENGRSKVLGPRDLDAWP